MGIKQTRRFREGPLDIEILRSGVLVSAHEPRHILGGADEIDSALRDLAIALTTHGDVVFRNAVGLERLAPGVAGQVLITAGPAADPSWGTGGHDFRIINSSHNVDYPCTQVGLQAAIDDLPAEGGWVRGPGLRTRIDVTTAITVPENVILEKVYIYVADGANCNGIENSDPVGGEEYIEISECRVNANWENQTANTNAILMDNVDQAWVHDCIIRGGRRQTTSEGEGIKFDTCSYGRISHNFCYEAYYDDIKIIDGYYCKIDNNICWGASQQSGGIQIGSGYYTSVTDNVVYKTGSGNAGRGIKAHSDAYALIANNWIRAETYAIDIIEACDFSLITGNYIYNPLIGILFRESPADNCQVIGNYIFANGAPRTGIEVEYGANHVIRENVISGYTVGQPIGTGIQIDADATDIRVIDNEGVWVTTGIVDNGVRTVIKENPTLESVSQGLYQSAAAFANPTGTFDLGDIVVFEETTGNTVRLYVSYTAGWRFFIQDG